MSDGSRPLVYFDANAFIYGLEGTPDIAEPIIRLLTALRERPGAAVTSELVLGEVLAPVRRRGATPVSRKRQMYLNLLVFNTFFELRPVTREIIVETADIREVTNLKLIDAIHVVTAIHANCRYFLSTDTDMRQLPQGMTRVTPDVAGVDMILKELG
jgi:predicted nucleic acid-binding protein